MNPRIKSENKIDLLEYYEKTEAYFSMTDSHISHLQPHCFPNSPDLVYVLHKLGIMPKMSINCVLVTQKIKLRKSRVGLFILNSM